MKCMKGDGIYLASTKWKKQQISQNEMEVTVNETWTKTGKDYLIVLLW